jgi:hypothetical protein
MDEWAQELRMNDFLVHLYTWSCLEGVEHIWGQAIIHALHGSQHFNDMSHLHHYHHQQGREDLFEGALFWNRPRGSVHGQAYVDDMWCPSGRHGSRGCGGSNGMFVDTNDQCRFHRQWPEGSANLVVNLFDPERQFNSHHLRSGSADLFANVFQSEYQFQSHQPLAGNDIYPNLDHAFCDFEPQPTLGSVIRLGPDWDFHEFDHPHRGSAASEWGPGLSDDGQQGIEDTFGGEATMPYGLLEGPLFGDRVFLDRESRPFAFHREHHRDNRFGDLDRRHDRLHHHQGQ